jgi:DNA-binding transcriptional MerR regulator
VTTTTKPRMEALKMRDLSRLTGLDRQTIHFYIKEGVLPEGEKTGRNTALYREEHLQRLNLIKRLQREQFLPLRVIAQVLENGGGTTKEETALLHGVRARLPLDLRVSDSKQIRVKDAAKKASVSERDVIELNRAGLLTLSEGALPDDQLFHIEFYGALVRAGLTRELGFSPKDLVIVADALDTLFAEEKRLLLERLKHLDPSAVAGVVERTLPIVSQYLARYHSERATQFFRSLGDPASPREAKPRSLKKARPSRRKTSRPTSRPIRKTNGAPR